MRVLISVVVLGLAVGACSQHPKALRPSAMTATQEATSQSDAYCNKLHNTEIALTTVTAVVGALSGSAGISAAFVDPDQQRIALGVTSIVAAAVTAGTGIWLGFVHNDFSLHCQLVTDIVVTVPVLKLPPFVDPKTPVPSLPPGIPGTSVLPRDTEP